MPSANRICSEDVIRVSLTHFFGRESYYRSHSAPLEETQAFGEVAAHLNHILSRQSTCQQEFDSSAKILKYYAEDAVDETWYLARYSDVAAARMNPNFHFTEHGRNELRFPNSFAEKIGAVSTYVDFEWYLKEYPDVAAAGMDAQTHFRCYGRGEGRFANILAKRRLGLAEYVDRNWYLSRYLDVAQCDRDPLEHYIRYGHEEGRFPSAAAENNNNYSKEDLAKFLSSLYRLTLSRGVGYFELMGWFEWYKLGILKCEIRAAVEVFCTFHNNSGQFCALGLDNRR